MHQKLYRGFEILLQIMSIALLLSLAVVVVLAVIYRYLGSSLVWYDEVASIQLAWLTYYGAALAALKRSHLGFPNLLLMIPTALRKAAFCVAEASIIGFFVVVGWAGWYVMGIFGDETLVSLTWVPLKYTQAIIPLGALLYLIAEILSMPDAWQKAMAGVDFEKVAIDAAIADARQNT